MSVAVLYLAPVGDCWGTEWWRMPDMFFNLMFERSFHIQFHSNSVMFDISLAASRHLNCCRMLWPMQSSDVWLPESQESSTPAPGPNILPSSCQGQGKAEALSQEERSQAAESESLRKLRSYEVKSIKLESSQSQVMLGQIGWLKHKLHGHLENLQAEQNEEQPQTEPSKSNGNDEPSSAEYEA